MKGKKAGPKITKISQLAGRRVGVIGKTQANVNLLKIILQQYSVDPAKVEIIQFPANEAAEAIRHQKADVYLAAGPLNSKITRGRDRGLQQGRRHADLPLRSMRRRRSRRTTPSTKPAKFPPAPSSPDRPDEEVKTISFSHHIVARKGLSDVTIAAFTRQLFSIRQQLMSEFPLAAKIETPDTDKDAVIPAHPGAAAFVDGEEKTFLDRYSDFIWWGLMALSAMGSVGAWFAGYLKKDERNNNSTLREKLLDMIAVARKSDSAEELDRMQSEADDILRDTLQLLRARRHRGRRADRLQHRARAIPPRGLRPPHAADQACRRTCSGQALNSAPRGALYQPASARLFRRSLPLNSLLL